MMDTEDIKLPRLDEIIGLYRTCMGLARDGETLLRAAGHLKRLALNSEIFSVKAGKKGWVFQSLSKETNRLSQDIAEVIHELMKSVEAISRKAIESAGKTRLCEKYQLAMSYGVQPPTRENVAARQLEVGQNLVHSLTEVFSALQKAHFMMRDMERLHVQLPVIATLMKIEANRESGFQDTFSTNAQNLLSLNEDLKMAMGSILEKTKETLERIELMDTGATV